MRAGPIGDGGLRRTVPAVFSAGSEVLFPEEEPEADEADEAVPSEPHS